MEERSVAIGILLALLICAPIANSQTEKPKSPPDPETALDGWGRPVVHPSGDRKSAPAPKHDISGIWEGPEITGIGVFGASNMPEDGKPEHQPPYTPAGAAALKLTKPSNGLRSVLPGDTNDPVFKYGDPQGMPREDLYELRTTQVLQRPDSIVLLYQFDKVWRVVWTDGREVPKDPEPRWFGYSVGKWVDDYTLVVETTGIKEETWIDRAGRPHSDQLHVEERFHRVDHDRLELTVTITDPKMYTKPWVALDKYPFDMMPATFDVREMIWSPSEYQRYNELMGNTASVPDPQ